MSLQERVISIEKQIEEFTVIDAELSSSLTINSVYTKATCGLVFYKADLATTLSDNKLKLKQLIEERKKLCPNQHSATTH
ncbi:hypothetical protein EMCRGX_G028003 [Ephydatia muelleri]